MTLRGHLAAVALLTILVAAGCGQAGTSKGLEGTTINFSIKVDDSERPAIQALLTRFQRQEKVTVNLEQLSRFRQPLGPTVNLVTDLDPKALIARVRKQVTTRTTGIDLFAQDNVALSDLTYPTLLVQNLSQLDRGRGDPPTDPGTPGLLSPYFLAFRPNVRVAYANKAAFTKAGLKPPTTEDEFTRAAAALVQSGQPKVTLSLAYGDPAAVTISELVLSHGGDPLVLNDAGSVEAFTFLQNLWRNGLLSPASFQAKYDTEVDNLLNGTSLLAENWPFTTARLAKLGRTQDFVVNQGWRGPTKEAHVIGGDVLGIPVGVQGKRLQAAVDLANFLRSKESQEFLARRNSWPSFRSDIDYSKLPKNQQATFNAIKEAQKSGWYRPSVPNWQEVSDRMNDAVQRIVERGQPVQAVLDDLHGQLVQSTSSGGSG
ncbi:MAG: trehalose transport system substrate-binding protein [Acidimicrobiaceae bacterium]|jgi:trehalose transport system substrate-binding protein|nr:trehalose transport system substrate-binding protein [Acidimicrobiaceae bacterium]